MEITYLSIDGEWKSHHVRDDAKTISMVKKEILYIELVQFSNLHNLEKLFMSNNLITTVDFSQLSECQQLDSLSLSFNQIDKIDFTNLPSGIRKLDLSENKISEVDFSPLSGHQIESLKVSDNKLQTIDLSPLSHCDRLVRIDLANNELKSIDFSGISQSPSLREIWLYMNRIKTVDLTPLRWLPTLSELRLERNQLQKIDLQPLRYSQRLKTLYLENNNIQVVDVSPMFHIASLAHFSVDPGVVLQASKDLELIHTTPDGLRASIPNIQWVGSIDTITPQPSIGNFLETTGFHGYQLRVINEINQSMKSDCPLAAAILCRKLFEGLVISIMMKRFGNTNPEYYMTKQGFATFKEILHKFWNIFDSDLKQWSPIQDQNRLREMRKLLEKLRVTFNVDVHQDGLSTTTKQLLDFNLAEVVDFLKHISDHVQGKLP